MLNAFMKHTIVVSFSLIAFSFAQKSEVVVPKINEKISRASFLRDKLPADAVFYARLPSQFGMAFNHKNKASDRIIGHAANEKVVLHLKKLLQNPVWVKVALQEYLAIPETLQMVDFNVLTTLLYTAINGPIEVMGVDPNNMISPATTALITIPVDFKSVKELEHTLGSLLQADMLLSFTNNFLQVSPMVSLYFVEKEKYLYVSAGMRPLSEDQFKGRVASLKTTNEHKMYSYENQIDLTGQNYFVWADVEGSRAMLVMLAQRDVPFIAEYIKNTEGVAYGVGTNIGKQGQARLISKTDTDKVSWLKSESVPPDFSIVGEPKNIAMIALPSKENVKAILAANSGTLGDLEEASNVIEGELGFNPLNLLDILGPQIIGYEDETGANLAIGIKDKTAFNALLNSIKKNTFVSYRMHKGVHELKIKNPLQGLIAKEASGTRGMSQAEAFMQRYAMAQPLVAEVISALYGIRVMDAYIYLYWRDEQDWIVVNTLPYALVERQKAKRSLASWFNQQGIQSHNIVVGFNGTLAGAQEKWYRDYLKFLRNNYDILGQQFDLFSMPAPSTVRFNPTSRIGLHVSKNSEWVVASLDYDISPFYALSMIGGQMNSIGVVGILSMFALPAYQDYTKRAYVHEGMALATAAKMASAEVHATLGIWPSNNQEAGLPAGDLITGQAVSSIDILPDAEIMIHYNNRVQSGGFVKLKGKVRGDFGPVYWECIDTNLAMMVLPANCRMQMISQQ